MAKSSTKKKSKPSEPDLFAVSAKAAARKPAPAARKAPKEAARSKSAGRGASAESGYTAKDIEVLEGLEPVRRRPGMYIGGTDEKALHHLFAEVIDNSM
ncbi:MAG: DNA topoisomerase IV subunit B, partial [Hyphomicrobiales bacterium]